MGHHLPTLEQIQNLPKLRRDANPSASQTSWDNVPARQSVSNPTMLISEAALSEIESAFWKYGDEVLASYLSERAKAIYIGNVSNFLRWLKGLHSRLSQGPLSAETKKRRAASQHIGVVMSQFKLGDPVTLKSGGPGMTVTGVDPYEGKPRVWCMWFHGNNLQRAHFPPEALELAEGEPSDPRNRVVSISR